MPYFVCLIFIGIIAIQASKPRSVNVALETVLEFDGKDDINFIDTIQKFLKKLKTTITNNRTVIDQANEHLENEGTNKQFIFTDFIADTINVLKSYKDEDFKTFFDSLNREIKTWQTRKEFRDITDKLGFTRLIDRNLQSLKNSPVIEIRRKLNTVLDKLKISHRNDNNRFFVGFLNYLHKKESEANLLNILNDLKLYRSRTRRNNKADLKRIIRNGILTIIDPLLKLNSKTIRNINSIFNKYIASNSAENNLVKLIKDNESKPKTSRQKHKFRNVLKDNKILDYIDDHIKVIDKHLTTASGIIANVKTVPIIVKSTDSTYEYVHSTGSRKNKKVKTKEGRIKITPHQKNNDKHLTKTIKNVGVADKVEDEIPVFIHLGSKVNSELKSVEEYLSSTTKRQKRHKKSTKRTSKSNLHVKTTKKFRKAFRTSTLSAEGMSIEHFGSLFGREFHRKNNDNDKFVQVVVNSTLAKVPNDATTTRNASNNSSKEMRTKNNVSIENKDYHPENHDETKNLSENGEENTKTIETIDEKHDLITESIKIKGNIIIEKPTEFTTHNKIEVSTLKPVETTKYRNFNVSIVTKYFNMKPMKPTIILRRQDKEISNETGINTSITFTVLKTTSTSTPTTKNSVNETEIDNGQVKSADDGLEKEIEDIMDRYNNTPIPVEFENFVNKVETNSGENQKVRDEMRADLAKLFASPSTKSTVTELFTDPFNDIDDAADIL